MGPLAPRQTEEPGALLPGLLLAARLALPGRSLPQEGAAGAAMCRAHTHLPVSSPGGNGWTWAFSSFSFSVPGGGTRHRERGGLYLSAKAA